MKKLNRKLFKKVFRNETHKVIQKFLKEETDY